VIGCGGPYDTSKPIEEQTNSQIKSEREYSILLKKVLEKDMLFFGICYIGVLNRIC
jgi:hypothetical protein